MLDWLFEITAITRLELIFTYGLTLISAILGGMGWIALREVLKPMPLSVFLLGLLREIPKVFHDLKNENKQHRPINNPDSDTENIEDTFIRGKTRPFRPVPRPNNSGSGRAEQEQDNAQHNLPHTDNLTQEKASGQPKTNETIFWFCLHLVDTTVIASEAKQSHKS